MDTSNESNIETFELTGEASFECAHCHTTYADADEAGAVESEDDGTVCSECEANEFVQANNGSGLVLILQEDATYIEDENRYVTQERLDDAYVYVSDRRNERVVRALDAVEIGGEWYSAGYASENFCQCEGCNAWLGNDSVFSTDAANYCEFCYPGDDADEDCGSLIKDYSTDPMKYLSFLGKPKDKVFYGLELEVETPNGDKRETAEAVQECLRDYAILKSDGSLDNGFEIVSAPATLSHHRAHITELLTDGDVSRTIRRGNLLSYKTATCGIHVHVSREGLSALQIGKMQVFLHNPENACFVDCVAQRPSSEYARRDSVKKLTDRGWDRYTALNLNNDATVELRIFKGTLNLQSALKCLEFTEALVHFTKLGAASIGESVRYQSFLHFIARPENAKQWPNLIAFLSSGKFNYLPSKRTNPRAAAVALPVAQES